MVNLSKIELTKKGQSINLSKSNTQSIGEILVNLNWNQQTKKSGGFFSSLLGGGSNGVDLDLGCLYELRNGQKGCVQALGNAFGSYHSAPFIELDGDDRTGAVSGGENLRINGNKIADIKRVLVYSFIYEGVANWSEADGVVTLKYPNG
jgi:tellurite resistance protein TerA